MHAKKTVRPLLLLAMAALATACGQTDAPEPAYPYDQAEVESPAAEEAPAAAAVEESRGLMWLEPLATCEKGQVSTLHWERELLAQGPVEIRFGEAPDGPLFGRVGSGGEKATGAWLKPGAVFVARSDDGTELARAVASGPDCAE